MPMRGKFINISIKKGSCLFGGNYFNKRRKLCGIDYKNKRSSLPEQIISA